MEQTGQKSKTEQWLKSEYPGGDREQAMLEDVPVWLTMASLNDANYTIYGSSS